MNGYAEMVKEFHKAFNLAAPDFLEEHIPEDVRDARVTLMREELDELVEAMEANNIAGIAHELADVLYTVFGTAISYGIPVGEVFTEVHRSNMTRTLDSRSGSARSKGVKGEGYRSPQIGKLLRPARRAV